MLGLLSPSDERDPGSPFHRRHRPRGNVLLPAPECPEGLGPLQRTFIQDVHPPVRAYGSTRCVSGTPSTDTRLRRDSPFTRPASPQGTAGRESARSRASVWALPNVRGRMEATRVTSSNTSRSGSVAVDFVRAPSCVRFAPAKTASSGTATPPVPPSTALRHSPQD